MTGLSVEHDTSSTVWRLQIPKSLPCNRHAMGIFRGNSYNLYEQASHVIINTLEMSLIYPRDNRR